MTNAERKKKLAQRQAEYRKAHPEYVARCREREKPFLEQYRAASKRELKEKITREWLREGMLTEGWKIEITHVFKGKVENNRQIVSEEMAFSSHNRALIYAFEKMLNEFGIKV